MAREGRDTVKTQVLGPLIVAAPMGLEDGPIILSDAEIVRLVRGRPAAEASDATVAARRRQGEPLYEAIVAKCASSVSQPLFGSTL
jgi:hypothetical protein